jgi:hypothetical protein
MQQNHLVTLPLSNRTTVAHLNRAVGLRHLIAMILVLGASLLYGCTPVIGLVVPADAKATCTVTTAGAPPFASWFESGTVTLNGAVKPADSVSFPNQPNCSFYQWSEQMYLWLTSPAPATYGGGDRIFDSPAFYDVSPLDANGDRTLIPHVRGTLSAFDLRAAQVGPHNLPIIFEKSGRMLEIIPPVIAPSGKQLILNESGEQVEIERVTADKEGKPIFLDTAGKTITGARPILPLELDKTLIVQKFMMDRIPILLDPFGNVVNVEQGQAGGDGVLQAQNGSLVYYAAMVNDVYAYFLTGTKNGAIPSPNGNFGNAKFPTTQTELNTIIAFASAHNKTFPDPNALAVEVKTSWVEAAGLSNLSSYITMQATIPTYDMSNPNQWTPNGQKTVKLAMVGIHVVGSTAGHSEMIWATFEHVNNAPNAEYSYINTNNATITVPQNTAGNWLFSANNSTGPFNELHMSFVTPNIESVSPFTISPSDTIRWKAWGGASDSRPNPLDTNTAASNTEIISINNSVRGMLASGDVRNNYIMTGSTWTIGGAAPTGFFPNGNQVGTSKLSNTTMETYQQGSNTLFATGTNCFSCHGTNTVRVSHIFCTPFNSSCPHGLKPLFP